MKKLTLSLLAAASLAILSGCVIAPLPYRGGGAAVVYEEPYYPSPGVGWVWVARGSRGGGWHHREHGWHHH
jgi:hypothetical protein